MNVQPILATEKKPNTESGIESIVRLYLRLENIAALSGLKVHRLKLISQATDTELFNFNLLREHCQQDISAVDAGLCELLKDEPLRGHVDVFSFQKIAGWAQYVQHPEVPASLGIYFDNELVVQVVADRYRPDLKEANLGSGHHGFEYVPWKRFLSAQVIEVKAPNGKTIGEYRKQQTSGR